MINLVCLEPKRPIEIFVNTLFMVKVQYIAIKGEKYVEIFYKLDIKR